MGMTFRGFTSGSDDDSNDESKKKPGSPKPVLGMPGLSFFCRAKLRFPVGFQFLYFLKIMTLLKFGITSVGTKSGFFVWFVLYRSRLL